MPSQTVESHQARLLYRLAPIDIGINIIAATILVAHYFESLRLNDIQIFLGIAAIICAIRLVFLLIARLSMDKETEQLTPVGTILLWTGSALIGTAWGLVPVLVPHFGLEQIIAEPTIALIISGLLISALAGSGMKNELWMAYTFPAIMLPLGNAVWIRDVESGVIWGFLFVVAFILTRANAGSSGMGTQLRKLAQTHIKTKSELTELKKANALYRQRQSQLSDALLTEQETHERTSKRLTSLEQEIGEILMDIKDVYFRCDKEGYITQISHGIADLIGIEATELLGTEFKHLFSSDQVYSSFAEAIDNKVGLVRNYKTALRHRFDNDVWVNINARYIKIGLSDREGITGLISYIETDDHLDITL